MAVLTILQAGMRPREARRAVLLPSRMKNGAVWVDVCIHNISSRGLMAATDDAPAPGSYVDIRRGQHVIIGRTVWRKGRFFGVRTQDRLAIDAIVNADRSRRPAGAADRRGADRGESKRIAGEVAIARRIERHREAGRLFQAVAIGAAVVGGACIVGHSAYQTLAAPAAAIAAALKE